MEKLQNGMLVDPTLDNVFMTNGYSEVKTEFGSGIVVEELIKQNIALGKAFVLSQHVLSGAEAKWLRNHLRLCQTGAAKMIGCTASEVIVYESRSIPVPVWYDKLLKLQWVMEYAEDDVDICGWTSAIIGETNLHYGKIMVSLTFDRKDFGIGSSKTPIFTKTKWLALVTKVT